MANPPRVPPTPGNGKPPEAQIQMPVIDLQSAGVAIQGGTTQNPVTGESQKALIVGPMMFAIRLDDDSRRKLVEFLTGVDIVRPAQFPFVKP